MSQAGLNNTSAGPVPPFVPTSFVTDSGTVIPALNVVNINGGQTSVDDNEGIRVIANTDLSNNELIQLTNRTTATQTTTDDTITTIISFPLGATPGTFYFYGNVQAFNSSTPSSGTYSYSGGFRTDGITATELGVELHDEFEDATLVSSEIYITSSGNNVLVQVQGVVGLSINWNALLQYRRVL